MGTISPDVTTDRQRWDRRYRDGAYSSPAGPSRLLEEFQDALPAGRALDVACGPGRNARFLADRGWTVDAVDVSRVALSRGRGRDRSVNWIQADVETYCLPADTYDVVNVTFFDARSRLEDLKAALARGGVLCYHHHLLSPTAAGGPSDRYRFASSELREACDDLAVLHYEERERERRAHVTLVARRE